jgi:phosphomannomutase/phosphoglucomutase
VNQNKLDLIFKAYDVRGIYGDTLTLETAYNIGVAFSEFVQSEKIIVGHDGRTSNLEIFNAVATGIKSKNKDVHYIGTVPYRCRILTIWITGSTWTNYYSIS